jgi:hypothetical protein
MGRKSCIVLVAFLSGFVSHRTFAGPETRPVVRLKVSVFNDASVPQPVLRTAQMRAEAVFKEAGISLTWLDCGVPGDWHRELGCQDVAFPTHLSVRLVAGKKAVSAGTFGQSYLNERGEGNYANVYAAQLSRCQGELLGYVVVHELGHLLLGKGSHSNAGLMRAKWQVEELREAARGNLSFTKSETERMQARYWLAAARAQSGLARYATPGKSTWR